MPHVALCCDESVVARLPSIKNTRFSLLYGHTPRKFPFVLTKATSRFIAHQALILYTISAQMSIESQCPKCRTLQKFQCSFYTMCTKYSHFCFKNMLSRVYLRCFLKKLANFFEKLQKFCIFCDLYNKC